jgi:hypothetical protein
MSGGEDTAQKLRQAVSDYVKKLDGISQRDPEIVIRIYANVEGLSKAYRDAKILAGSSQLDFFLRGFNRSHPLCDFVDAGNDKEAADGKIKGKRKLLLARFGQLTGECRNPEAIFSECPLQTHSIRWVGRQ